MLTSDYRAVATFVQVLTDCSLPEEGGAAIGWVRDDSITCGVLYEHFTGRSITATIAKANGAVIPPGFLRAIFDYPFKQLNCEKILAYIEETNWKSRQLVERMGFKEEAKVSNVFPEGDMIIYTVTAEECRYLENEDGQENKDS